MAKCAVSGQSDWDFDTLTFFFFFFFFLNGKIWSEVIECRNNFCTLLVSKIYINSHNSNSDLLKMFTDFVGRREIERWGNVNNEVIGFDLSLCKSVAVGRAADVFRLPWFKENEFESVWFCLLIQNDLHKIVKKKTLKRNEMKLMFNLKI